MIEKIVFDYLRSQEIEDIGNNVFMEVPEPPPERYILIEKTGSGRENRIDNATIAVQSISRNRDNGLIQAARTNEAVKAAMNEFADNSADIYACRLDTDYNFSNAATREYRYQAVYNIFY